MMQCFEKEIKILNVDIEEAHSKLLKLGAEFINIKEQKIYTYDIPTIYYRFLEAKELLKSDNVLLIKTTIKKLEIIFDEFSDLISDDLLMRIYNDLNITSFNDFLNQTKDEILNKLNNSKLLEDCIKNHLINPNKWVRLRQSNDKVELTIKHVYMKNSSNIQKVAEFEITVSSLEKANGLLESLGIVKRNYQEKIRHSYKYKSAEIEIDEWPLLEPYIEIECEDKEIMEEIIKKLQYNGKEIVSLNTEQLYKRKNIDILKISDLKFNY